MSLGELEDAWEAPLEDIFPTKAKAASRHCPQRRSSFDDPRRIPRPKCTSYSLRGVAHPGLPRHELRIRHAAPVHRGRSAKCDDLRHPQPLTPKDIAESVDEFEKLIRRSQIIMIPGGFSGGDEPDGSGKFITSFFRNPRISDAVNDLMSNRDGLMLGICNGFQALIKLGLVPYGEIREMDPGCPTLTFNTIGRHQSTMVRTRISSVKSPWLMYVNDGDVFTVPVSHGEGRFVATPEMIDSLAANGQIATQYVDFAGHPSMDIAFNPNGSADAIEGITSPDGRILGKMGHSERCGKFVAKNIDGNKDQRIFSAGVDYFSI
jgi:phosphoribosylformylglycinamidine synthase